jgi:hypothetical protein
MYYVTLGNIGRCAISDPCDPLPGSGLLNRGPISQLDGSYYWSTPLNDGDPNPFVEWAFSMATGSQGLFTGNPATAPAPAAVASYNVWPVHEGDVGAAADVSSTTRPLWWDWYWWLIIGPIIALGVFTTWHTFRSRWSRGR